MDIDLKAILGESGSETGKQSIKREGLRCYLTLNKQRPLPDHAPNADKKLLWSGVEVDAGKKAFSLDRGWPLTLIGETGTGKSALAGLVYMYAKDRHNGLIDSMPSSPFWINAAEGFKAVVTATVENPKPLWGVCIYASWAEPDHWLELVERGKNLVVLDDIGLRDRATDAQFEAFQKFLLYRENKPTIITSNLDLDGIHRVYDDRIASRLAAGTIVAMRGKDRRVS